MHRELIIYAGNETDATRALIMIHGRGASAEDILSLSENLNVENYLLAAPQATGNSWYPNSFLAPQKANEPWLSSALDLVNMTVQAIIARGIGAENIYFLGFSQGACLTSEYVARNAKRYGGVIAFTGGLIGDQINKTLYKGDFDNTPVFFGSSNPDMHVPVDRVDASAEIFRQMGADVTEKIYPQMGHTINQDEINKANSLILK
ncbi:MAG TPA: dienelactone hydrolase family protein [Puia sp.]|jgi:phospholipase/carboxylesterase|nr:dienelactone hydrolase family protein [Puia sp.]